MPRWRGDRSETADGQRETQRGQTVIDFAIGAGVFLITVGVVFTFVPSIFEPFGTAGGGTPIGADRVATHLSGQLLAVDPASPTALSGACTAAFFGENDMLAEEANCGFAPTDDLDALVGVGDNDVSIAVREVSDDPRSGEAIDRTVDGTDYTLSRETDGIPSNVAIATRTVTIDGDRYRLVVKVW